MSNDTRDLMISWLRDAHAMERSLENVLARQADHAEDPELKGRIERHMEETRNQAQRLEECLAHYGSDTSTVKDIMTRITGFIQGASTWTADDVAVKDILMGIAAEHFEIACYRALETAAEELGDSDTAAMAHQNRQEEQDYLLFLERRLPDQVRKVMGQHAYAAR